MMPQRERGLVAFSQRAVWPLGALLLILYLLRLSPLPLERVFIVLFTSILLASAVAPAARFLARYGIPRSVSILLIYLAILLILTGVVALIVPLVVSEVNSLQASLPQYGDELQRQVARVAPEQASKLSGASAFSQVSGRLSGFAGELTGIVFSLVSTSVTVVLILVMAFFMADEENFARQIISRFVPPAQRPQVSRVMGKIGTRLGQWARAQLLLALFFGVAFGIGLRVVGVHYAVTLGVIGGVLEIIPYVGGFITVGLALLLALTQNPVLAIWVVAWYTIVVELEGHVIAPKLMDRVLGIHPLVVVASLFLGGESLGILGALLAVPIAIVIQALLDEFYVFEDRKDKQASELAAAPTALRADGSPPASQPPSRVG
ncbi:MAG: AI-2E family transporter [Dehalococcoidia bacterium]